ncbi:MAG TPA: hypothetical protein VIZ43_26560 [Trebonia sp.]
MTFGTAKDGWVVSVGQLQAYDPDEIDLFFILDGDMTMYLIPSRAIAGRVRILRRTYEKYVVGKARGLLEVAAHADGAGVRAST